MTLKYPTNCLSIVCLLLLSTFAKNVTAISDKFTEDSISTEKIQAKHPFMTRLKANPNYIKKHLL
jgi:protoheme ferro-lyase